MQGPLRTDYFKATERLLKSYKTQSKIYPDPKGSARVDPDRTIIKKVVDAFSDRHEFVVIRMYYFGEDLDGSEHGPWTIEDMTYELAARRICSTTRTVCRWRAMLVQEMAVAIYGPPAAAQFETRESKPDTGAKSAMRRAKQQHSE